MIVFWRVWMSALWYLGKLSVTVHRKRAHHFSFFFFKFFIPPLPFIKFIFIVRSKHPNLIAFTSQPFLLPLVWSPPSLILHLHHQMRFRVFSSFSVLFWARPGPVLGLFLIFSEWGRHSQHAPIHGPCTTTNYMKNALLDISVLSLPSWWVLLILLVLRQRLLIVCGINQIIIVILVLVKETLPHKTHLSVSLDVVSDILPTLVLHHLFKLYSIINNAWDLIAPLFPNQYHWPSPSPIIDFWFALLNFLANTLLPLVSLFRTIPLIILLFCIFSE